MIGFVKEKKQRWACHQARDLVHSTTVLLSAMLTIKKIFRLDYLKSVAINDGNKNS